MTDEPDIDDLVDDQEDEEGEDEFTLLAAHQAALMARLEAIEQNQNALVALLTEKIGDKVRVRVNAASGQAATIKARQGRQAARWGISPEEWRYLVGENETVIPAGMDMFEAIARLREEQTSLVEPEPEPPPAAAKKKAKKKTKAKKKAAKKKTKKKAAKKRAKKV